MQDVVHIDVDFVVEDNMVELIQSTYDHHVAFQLIHQVSPGCGSEIRIIGRRANVISWMKWYEMDPDNALDYFEEYHGEGIELTAEQVYG